MILSRDFIDQLLYQIERKKSILGCGRIGDKILT